MGKSELAITKHEAPTSKREKRRQDGRRAVLSEHARERVNCRACVEKKGRTEKNFSGRKRKGGSREKSNNPLRNE